MPTNPRWMAAFFRRVCAERFCWAMRLIWGLQLPTTSDQLRQSAPVLWVWGATLSFVPPGVAMCDGV